MIDEPKYTLPHDSSNALILPVTAKKKKINEDVEEEIVSKKRKLIKPSLSKKKQKQLQKILERKKKRFSVHKNNFLSSFFRKILFTCFICILTLANRSFG